MNHKARIICLYCVKPCSFFFFFFSAFNVHAQQLTVKNHLVHTVAILLYCFKDAACFRPCLEDAGYVCGCADHGCPEDMIKAGDAEFRRRWVIYKIADTDNSGKGVKEL